MLSVQLHAHSTAKHSLQKRSIAMENGGTQAMLDLIPG
jgi:hypothetical protein